MADVQLVLDRPIAAAVADRFVIRDVSAQRTIGGGRFIDLRPPARRRRTPERQAQRAALAIADPLAAFARSAGSAALRVGSGRSSRETALVAPSQSGCLAE